MKKLLCLLAGLSAFHCMANSVYTKDVRLPQKEILALEQMACMAPHNLKAERVQGFKDIESKAAFDSAFVQCKAHDYFRNQPVNYQTGCSFLEGKWQCNKEGIETLFRLGDKDIKIRPWGISLEASYDILSKISTYGSFQNTRMTDAIGSSCHITPAKDGETVELNCKDIITLSFWCPKPELTKCPRVLYISPQPEIFKE